MKQGTCDICGKIFDRPNGYKTESEAMHIRLCHLQRIQNIVNNEELKELSIGEKQMLVDELNHISKVLSFGAIPEGNIYLEKMKETNKLIKKIENEHNNRK